MVKKSVNNQPPRYLFRLKPRFIYLIDQPSFKNQFLQPKKTNHHIFNVHHEKNCAELKRELGR